MISNETQLEELLDMEQERCREALYKNMESTTIKPFPNKPDQNAGESY